MEIGEAREMDCVLIREMKVDGLDRAMHGCSPKNRGKVPGMSQPTKSISFANEEVRSTGHRHR